jgi:hypothetical protein
MFGYAAFFIHGNLACGVQGNELIVRVTPSSRSARERGARAFSPSGRVMREWVVVEPAKIGGAKALSTWVLRGVSRRPSHECEAQIGTRLSKLTTCEAWRRAFRLALRKIAQ